MINFKFKNLNTNNFIKNLILTTYKHNVINKNNISFQNSFY
jgi:hypothetical protein